MNENDLKYYKIIGKIQACVSTAATFDDAIKGGLKIIRDNSLADYAVIWRISENDPNTLYPFYWICPVDLTTCKYEKGNGLVGKAYQSGHVELLNDFKDHPEENSQKNLEGIDVTSICVVPFSSNTMDLGCIEFIKRGYSGNFTEEEVDAYQLLSLMIQTSLQEDGPLPTHNEQGEVLISVRDIKKDFLNGDQIAHVLRGVNFDVFKGEFLCFLGESGCGKSTMLNIMGGLLKADEGTINFGDEIITSYNEDKLTKFRRENIGFIFQAYNLMPNLTAKENLELIAELVKEPMDSIEALKMVGLYDKKDNYPSQLSGGQQQRISIARALIKKPLLILADEPTAALDYETSIEVLHVLEEVVKQGTTLVMVTHNEEITKMANRVIRFRKGKTFEITVNNHPAHAEELEW